MNYKDMTVENIIEWCVSHEEVDWLKATAKKTFPTEDGKERKITFIELKLEFVKEFMPEIAPKAKEKKLSMYDRIANL